MKRLIFIMVLPFLAYLLAFAGIWVGAGLAIKSVERLSNTLKLSSFSVSFLILGFFTSVSELSVGVNAVLAKDPEIYVGNLIGASIVIFMMIVPLLAMTGGRLEISNELRGFNLAFSLIVIAAPVLLSMDGRVGMLDSVISILLYILLFFFIEKKRGILEKVEHFSPFISLHTGREMFRIVFGVALIFIASRFVVAETLYFAERFQISPFLISLLCIAIGTNLPELSFVVRSFFLKNNQVAFGDYVGSAAFNTFLFGLLTLIYGQPVFLTNSYQVSLLFLIAGLSSFYIFARTRNQITRLEGLILLMIYIFFLLTEVFIH